MRIIGEIPARLGSQRLKNKNLRLLNGKPMIAYAIEAAKGARSLNEVYVNTEADAIGEVAHDFGVQFYRRSEQLASNTALQEEFNYDFIKNTGADVLVMINPVSPLITSEDIDAVVGFFLAGEYDTVITVESLKQQAFYQDRPVNIDPERFLRPTQEVSPIQLCAWSVTVWRAKTFISMYEEKQCGAFGGKLGFYSLEREKCIKISYESDFLLAEALMQARKQPHREPEFYVPIKSRNY